MQNLMKTREEGRMICLLFNKYWSNYTIAISMHWEIL
jgi:hypothetical protein